MFLRIIIVFTILFSTNAYAGYLSEQDHFYGIGFGIQQISFKPNYGDEFFPNSTTDLSLFIGSQDTHKFGYEFGFNCSSEKSTYTTLIAGEKYPGTIVPLLPGEYEIYKSSFATESMYLGINRFIPITKSGKIKAFGFAGLSIAHVEAIINFIDDDLPGLPSEYSKEERKRTFDELAIMPIIKMGVEYTHNDNFGCRVVYAWKNYSAFPAIGPEENIHSKAKLKLGNTNSVYIELVLTL